MMYLFQFMVTCTTCVMFVSMKKQNIVLLYIENINEVMKVLKLLDPEQESSKDVLGNIRKLYNESIQFHNLYGEVASASNFGALITGKPAVDLGIIRGRILPFDYFPSIASTGGLKADEVTLAEVLKDCGYRTWFTGYWKMGLGRNGNGFPMKHGFDTWMGVAHPHDEWCRRKDVDDVKNEKNHPYMYLLYKIFFLWSLVFLLLTVLVWLKFVGVKLYINLIIYTFSTSFAFYILLHLFMIQRSASCVLYYHDFIYQQPYEAKNLTLHFTRYSSKLIEASANETPFFMVLNYLKMKPPYFHSNFFRRQSTNTWSSSLLELDWSIGEIINTLKETNVYNDTVIIMTGNNNCEFNLQDTDMSAYERVNRNHFRKIKVPANTLSDDCLNLPFFIKESSDENSKILTNNVFEHVSVQDIFQTVLDISKCDVKQNYPYSLKKLYRKRHCSTTTTDDISGNDTLLTDTFPLDSTNISMPVLFSDGINEIAEDKGHDDMTWTVETEDREVVIETYVKTADAKKISCEQNDIYFNRHVCMFHYYNVHKPMSVTYKGAYKVLYSSYYGSGYVEKLNLPIIVDMGSSNVSQQQLEEVYNNVTLLLQAHLIERHSSRNSYSSEFEMPVYPWLMPCANFPRCETHGENEDIDFTKLMSSLPVK